MSERIPPEKFRQMQEGDKSAWDWFWQQYGDFFLNYAYRKVRNREDAKEIVQDAMKDLWEKRYSLEYLTTAWVFQRILWKILELLRNGLLRESLFNDLGNENEEGKPQLFDPKDPKQPDVKEELEFKEFINRLMEILEDLGSDKITLTPEQSEAFRLRYIDGLSLDEIAEIQDVEKDTVKKRIRAARDKLFWILKSYDDL